MTDIYAFALGAITFILILAFVDTLCDNRKRKPKPSLPKRLVLLNAQRDKENSDPNRIAIERILE